MRPRADEITAVEWCGLLAIHVLARTGAAASDEGIVQLTALSVINTRSRAGPCRRILWLLLLLCADVWKEAQAAASGELGKFADCIVRFAPLVSRSRNRSEQGAAVSREAEE
jgi:hypothetical protein